MKEIWTTAEGVKIKFEDLTDAHLMAILDGGFADDEFYRLEKIAKARGFDTKKANEYRQQRAQDDLDNWAFLVGRCDMVQ